MFRDWRPDLPDFVNNGVIKALNAVPIVGGFGPTRQWVDSGDDALPDTCLGGWAARDNLRKAHIFAGTSATLQHIYAAGLVDVSRAIGYTLSGQDQWNYASFGDNVFAASPNNDLQYFDLRGSTLFDDVANYPVTLGQPRSPYVPRARHLGVVGQFVVLGNYYDGIDGSVPNGVAWGGIGNPLYWPDPNSDDRAAVQSDRQALEGDGGWVMAVVGGAEVGAVFRESAIHRMDYRGGADVFDIIKVEEEFGCMVPGLAIPAGRKILFYSESGWRIFDYTQTYPAGKGRIDAWFKADLDTSYPHRVRALTNPDETTIVISYPGAGNVGGNPNRLLFYDHALDRFSHGDQVVDCLAPYLPPLSGAGTMDDPVVPMDTDPFPMDALSGAAGDWALGAWDTNHKFGDFSGDYRDVTFETGLLELNPGRRARVTEVRPLVNGEQLSRLRISAVESLSKPDKFAAAIALTATGIFPARTEGRYHKLRLELDGDYFENAVGLDISATDAGTR
jgi:hypothetical protein